MNNPNKIPGYTPKTEWVQEWVNGVVDNTQNKSGSGIVPEVKLPIIPSTMDQEIFSRDKRNEIAALKKIDIEQQEKKEQKIEDKYKRTVTNFVDNPGFIGDSVKRIVSEEYLRYLEEHPKAPEQELLAQEKTISKKYNTNTLSASLIAEGGEREADLSDIETKLKKENADHSPLIIESTRDVLLDRIAESHVNEYLKGSENFDQYKTTDKTNQFANPEIQKRFTNKLQSKISTEVELMKSKVDVGIVKKEDLEALIKDGGPVNPLLKEEYKKIFKEKFETKHETDSEKKEKVKEQGKEFLENVLKDVKAESKFEDLIKNLTDSEDINLLPEVVKKTVKARLESMKALRAIEVKGIPLAEGLLNSQKDLEQIKLSQADLKVVAERAKWIFSGLAVGGLVGSVLVGNWAALTALLPGGVAAGSVAMGLSGTGGIAGAVAGLSGGIIIPNRGILNMFRSKNLIEQKIEVAKSKQAINVFEKKFEEGKIDDSKKLVKAQKDAVEIVAAIASSMKGLDLEDITKEYLKNAGITQALAVL
jgi:hypothetical protein